MNAVFADAFYYFALLNLRDNAHGKAVEFTSGFDGRLVTSAWVLTEVADTLAEAGHRLKFVKWFEALKSDKKTIMILPTPVLVKSKRERSFLLRSSAIVARVEPHAPSPAGVGAATPQCRS